MSIALLPLLLALGQPPSAAPAITLALDATRAPRHLFHTTMTIPVKPGPLTLVYPNWIPGEHAGMGPVSDLAGLVIAAGDAPLKWRRDLVQMHAVHCEVPAGADKVEVQLDYLSPLSEGTFTDGPAGTSQLAVIDWHLMLMYPYPFDETHPPPANYTDTLTFAATIRMPRGWKGGGSLPQAPEAAAGSMTFAPVSLTQLVDHPIVIGAHFREIDLTPGEKPEHRMDLVADTEADLDIPEGRVERYGSLVQQAAALMGARRYERYHFLVTLSDRMSHFGLEHSECSDDRAAARFLADDDEHRADAGLLSHEYFHSWNGKFRRPRGLATPDYQVPMKTDLLWVYEGLTEYYGDVLAARCGNWTQEEYREYLAKTIAALDHTPGRVWRSLQDTCDAAPVLYSAGGTYGSWRRGTDFYDEGELIWLEADTIIRAKTKGAKSLDDFCRAFHGSGGSLSGQTPRVEPYDFEDVCNAMDAVAPNDWRAFFRGRLDALTAATPKDGLTAAGYALEYTTEPNEFVKNAADFSCSIGLTIKETGEADNIVRGMAADKAGIGPGMKVMGVNGKRYSAEILRSAIEAASESGRVELLVQDDEELLPIKIEYRGGLRYPHLKKLGGRPDVLADILTPLAEK